MKNKSRLPSLLALAFLLIGCGEQTSSSTTSSAESSSSEESLSSISSESSTSSASSSSQESTIVIDDVTFLPKQVPTYVHKPTNPTKMTAYYRQDGLSNLPYVKLGDFYHNHVGKNLSFVEETPGVFVVTSAGGGIATIDTIANTLDSDDLESFINTTIYRQEGVANTYYDGAPYIRIKETIYSEPIAPKHIEFGDTYGIDLFALDGEVLLPLVTCSNLFQGPTMLTCFYSPKAIYFIDPNDPNYETSHLVYSEDYIHEIAGFFKKGKRSQEQADFSYDELRFFIDTFHGRPGREALHASLLEYGNLDDALANHDYYTKQIRVLLRSTDQIEFYAGLLMLDAYLNDTGHTVIKAGLRAFLARNPDISDEVDKYLDFIGFKAKDVQATRKGLKEDYTSALYGARREMELENGSQVIVGNTLLYSFTGFNIDFTSWSNYYAGKQKDLPDDPVGTFKKILEKYKDGKTIKNIVVDLSANGGGFGDVVFTFMALMGKGAYVHCFDTVNQCRSDTTYEVDLNFDGVFDEKDKEVSYPYNFAILCSAYSFSCANLLPTQAKESGILLLGDETGGGACAVLDGCGAEGLYNRISSQIRLEAKDGSSVDFGVQPDIKLYDYVDEKYDFSKFYDVALMGEYMDEHYK